jgi:hypothetical protein
MHTTLQNNILGFMIHILANNFLWATKLPRYRSTWREWNTFLCLS